jgi:ankyrin repeat protein
LSLGRESGRVGDEELAALIRAFPAAAAERNWIGRTALHVAVRNDHGSPVVVAALLRAHPAAADRDGLFCRTCDYILAKWMESSDFHWIVYVFMTTLPLLDTSRLECDVSPNVVATCCHLYLLSMMLEALLPSLFSVS